MTTEDIIRLAAEVGAKAALEIWEQKISKANDEMQDWRLRNTKLLLKNYRNFKDHAANAVFEAETKEDPMQVIEDLMMPGKTVNYRVESIKASAMKTVTIVRHIDAMLGLYKKSCFQYGSEEDERRWRVINGLYISDNRTSVAELAEIECVGERTIYKDIDAACERISILIFGVDGIRRK